mgnify:CR=1 FL=1
MIVISWSKARLIGYEFQENAEQARLQSNADVIFAINKKDPETYTAITEQSQPITCELGKHTSIINEIIKAEYFLAGIMLGMSAAMMNTSKFLAFSIHQS